MKERLQKISNSRSIINKTVLYTIIIFTGLSCKKDEVQPVNADNTSIEISETQITLNVTEHQQLAIGGNGTSSVVWSSQNPSIASVNSNGEVIGINSGETIITAKINDIEKHCNVTVSTTIFICGHEYDTGIGKAKLWINDELTELGNDYAEALAVENGVSYVAGSKGTDGFTSTAKLWVDKNETNITGFGTYASSSGIAIHGSDIYVSGLIEGSTNSISTYWKNDVRTELTDGNYQAKTNDIFVSTANDVYVAGYEYDSQFIQYAKIWKNGIEQVLSTVKSHATSLCIDNGNVYVGGQEVNTNTNKYKATIWVNGIADYLTTGNFHANVYDVLLANNELYAVGYSESQQERIAVLWKDGFQTELTDGNYNSHASAISVFNGEVYIVGQVYDGTKYNGVIWKNGIVIKTINEFPNNIVLTDIVVR